MPSITVKELKLLESDGRLKVSFTIHQDTETPYQLDIPVLITTKYIQINKTITASYLFGIRTVNFVPTLSSLLI